MQILIIRSGVEFTQGVSECNSHSRGRVEMVVLRVYSRCCRGRKLLRFLNIHPYALPLFLRGAVAYAARTTLDCVKYEHALMTVRSAACSGITSLLSIANIKPSLTVHYSLRA